MICRDYDLRQGNWARIYAAFKVRDDESLNEISKEGKLRGDLVINWIVDVKEESKIHSVSCFGNLNRW